ncbi:MAG: NB-ARC domain-containing protein, partial [Anaerolineae bacterium]
MNKKQPLITWLLLLAGATIVIVILSLFVARLHAPWNWLIPFAFLVLANIVGFLSDFLGIRSALRGDTPASQHVTEIKDSQVAQTTGDVFQAGGDILLQAYRTPARAQRLHTPPATRHRLFGRDDALADTLTALREHRSVLLHGMGGIGKTALAGHSAQRLHAEAAFNAGVLWVSEVGPASVPAICDAVARSLGDEEILKLAPPAKLDPTRELLASHDLLLILDDIAMPETAQEFLDCCRPAGLALLATSRRRLVDFGVDVPLRPLDRDAATDLFRNRAKMPAADGKVGEICDELENHPLALVIAAGRVRAERMSLESLHRRLRDEKERLPTLVLGKGLDKNRNVWASLHLSYQDLSDQQQLVFTRLAACFGETTGLELLAGVCGMTQTACEDHVGRLVARSLVERQADRLSLHRLVRD